MGCALRAFQSVSSRTLQPISIEFTHPAPAQLAGHERFFGCRTSFGQADDVMVFTEDVLAIPAARPDAVLKGVLLRYADAVSEKAPTSERMTDRVERWALQQVGKGPLSIRAAAKWLGVSGRTLQRKLESEGARFRCLVDKVRERLARSYLASRDMGVGEVAGLLGYADVRAFHRAFVGWTGSTPGRFRKTAGAA
jgi:AraC-like DNA-binding protein